jgi:hypothetical protein
MTGCLGVRRCASARNSIRPRACRGSKPACSDPRQGNVARGSGQTEPNVRARAAAVSRKSERDLGSGSTCHETDDGRRSPGRVQVTNAIPRQDPVGPEDQRPSSRDGTALAAGARQGIRNLPMTDSTRRLQGPSRRSRRAPSRAAGAGLPSGGGGSSSGCSITASRKRWMGTAVLRLICDGLLRFVVVHPSTSGACLQVPGRFLTQDARCLGSIASSTGSERVDGRPGRDIARTGRPQTGGAAHGRHVRRAGVRQVHVSERA